MNNNYDEIDYLLFNHFKNSSSVPDLITNGIKSALNKKNKSTLFFKKLILLITGFITITSGFVFSKNITILVNNLAKNMFGNYNSGITTAIENGYIEHSNVNYTDSNNTKVKVTSILMDDYNLNIIFEINLPNLNNEYKIKNFEIPNLIITDEINNIIVAKFENNEQYEKFCNDRGIKIEYKNIAYGDGSENAKVINKTSDGYKYSYSTQSSEFPKSKKLKIQFNKINVLFEQHVDNVPQQIVGNWTIDLDLPEEFYNRETIIYKVVNCNSKEVNITRATVSKTGMKIDLETKWGNSVYDNEDSLEDKKSKIAEWLNTKEKNRVTNKLIQNEYVINSNGKKYYPLISSDSDNWYGQSADGIFLYHQTFNLTSFDSTDKLKVVLPFGGELKKNNDENQIVIELEKSR